MRFLFLIIFNILNKIKTLSNYKIIQRLMEAIARSEQILKKNYWQRWIQVTIMRYYYYLIKNSINLFFKADKQ